MNRSREQRGTKHHLLERHTRWDSSFVKEGRYTMMEEAERSTKKEEKDKSVEKWERRI